MNRERFWGLHFDFHADDNSRVGERTNSEDMSVIFFPLVLILFSATVRDIRELRAIPQRLEERQNNTFPTILRFGWRRLTSIISPFIYIIPE